MIKLGDLRVSLRWLGIRIRFICRMGRSRFWFRGGPSAEGSESDERERGKPGMEGEGNERHGGSA